MGLDTILDSIPEPIIEDKLSQSTSRNALRLLRRIAEPCSLDAEFPTQMTADQVDRLDEPGPALFSKRPERSVPVGVLGQLTVAVDVHGADRGSSSTNRCRAGLPSLEFQALCQAAVEGWASGSDNEIGGDGGTKAIGRSKPAAGAAVDSNDVPARCSEDERCAEALVAMSCPGLSGGFGVGSRRRP